MRSSGWPRSVALVALLALLAGALSAALPAAAQIETPRRACSPRPRAGATSCRISTRTRSPTPYDMFVLDYSRDGTDAQALTAAEVEGSEEARRRPPSCCAYLSIGEAEKYRYYWKWYWVVLRTSSRRRGAAAPTTSGGETTACAIGTRTGRTSSSTAPTAISSASSRRVRRRLSRQGRRVRRHGPGQPRCPRPDDRLRQGARRACPRVAARLSDRAAERRGAAHRRDYRAAIDGLGKEDLLFGEIKDKQPNQPERIEANVALLKLLTATASRCSSSNISTSRGRSKPPASSSMMASFRSSPTARSITCASAIRRSGPLARQEQRWPRVAWPRLSRLGLSATLAALALIAVAVGAAWSASGRSRPPPAPVGRRQDWGYQPQKLDPDTLAAVPHDVLVIDYSGTARFSRPNGRGGRQAQGQARRQPPHRAQRICRSARPRSIAILAVVLVPGQFAPPWRALQGLASGNFESDMVRGLAGHHLPRRRDLISSASSGGVRRRLSRQGRRVRARPRTNLPMPVPR